MSVKFKFYKSDSKNDFQYIKVPKDLIHGQQYAGLSLGAKYLYIAMLERQSLSVKNNWTDKSGNIYIILSQSEAAKILSCARSTVNKIFDELDSKEGAGLIQRKRQGLGKPDIIYLNSVFVSDYSEINADDSQISVQNEDTRMCKNKTSGCINNTHQDVLNSDTNNINNNKNKINKNNFNYQSFHINQYSWIEERNDYTEIIKSNIDYNILTENCRKDIIDEIINTMVNAICTSKNFVRISGENIPIEEIKKRFLSMNNTHIEYVYTCLMKNTSDVRNIGAYLLTSLYRASDNINIHYSMMVNHDLCHKAGG